MLCLVTGWVVTCGLIGEKVEKMSELIEVKKVVETLMNKYRVVSNDEDLEWNRAIDYAIKIIKDEEND